MKDERRLCGERIESLALLRLTINNHNCDSKLRCFSLLLVFVSGGCNHSSAFYEIPQQRTVPDAAEIRPVSLLWMSDLDAEENIVGGVAQGDPGSAWRWSYEKPTFHFRLRSGVRYSALLDFAIADSTFQTTGPVTISFFVNSQFLGKSTYPKPGNYRFESTLLPAEITMGGDATLSADISPVWVSPADGVKLGVILKEAGFLPH